MDIQEFISAVPEYLKPENKTGYQVIDLINFESDNQINAQSIVICGLAEYKDFYDIDDKYFSEIRNHFYLLSKSNWNRNIIDLGTILAGNSFEDSCFALHQVSRHVMEVGATMIVLGGTQALSYILYQSIQKDLMKVGTLDIKLDIDGLQENLTADNHITKMILNENNRLLDFFNLGSQAPYVAKEELDILEQLNFENIRLGKVNKDISIAEPYLRELDLLSIDMNVMAHSSFKSMLNLSPNGFDSSEICGLMRYAGLNENLKIVHISNFHPELSENDSSLVAEMIWYFVEAQNNQKSDGDIQTYHVQLEDNEIIFIKSLNSERWWIQMKINNQTRNIPCSVHDYDKAMTGEFPDVWLKFYKKFY